MAPPLGLHCAAETLVIRVRGIASSILLEFRASAPQPSCGPEGRRYPPGQRSAPRLRPRAIARPAGETAPGDSRHRDKDPRAPRADSIAGRWNEPRSARAVTPEEAIPTIVSELNSTWVIVSAILVIFMQAGFLFLEIGFSRGKNVGSGVAKILVNFSIATIVWWAVGFGLAFGGAATIFGDSGFFVKFGSAICAVSLAIVWGTTLERLKFAAYAIFAVVFAGLIYPLIAHWGFGGGLYAD